MAFEPPIQNVDSIDVIGERKDGGVDLAVVASGPLDGSSATLAYLERKIRNYITEVASDEFGRRFPSAVAGKVRILVICEYDVDDRARLVVERLQSIARTVGADLQIQRTPLS